MVIKKRFLYLSSIQDDPAFSGNQKSDKMKVQENESLKKLAPQANNDSFFNEDCPQCGGIMEIDPDKSQYIHTFGDGYNSPAEYEPIKEVYKCVDCNYLETR